MSRKSKERKCSVKDQPVNLVGLMFAFERVVGDMKQMTTSMERLAKKLQCAMRNGTTGSDRK